MELDRNSHDTIGKIKMMGAKISAEMAVKVEDIEDLEQRYQHVSTPDDNGYRCVQVILYRAADACCQSAIASSRNSLAR